MPLQKIGSGPNQANSTYNPIAISLLSGQNYMIPSGQYAVILGPYTCVQYWDPITLFWRPVQTPANSDTLFVSSDGYNYRLSNITGTVVGALVTNGGTQTVANNGIYPWSAGSPFIATADTGLTRFTVIIGGAVSATVTVAAGGAGYSLPPIVVVDPPPPGGVPATMTATLSGGAVSAVTVVNQGAGYPAAPGIRFVTQPGDAGGGAAATAALDATVNGTVTALVCTQSRQALSAVSTIAFTGVPGSPAATAIMCLTSLTLALTGASNGGNGSLLTIASGVTGGSSTTVNPAITTGLFTPRMGFCDPSTSATPTAQTVRDGGLHQVAPSAVISYNSNGTISAATTVTTNTYGGRTDTAFLMPL